MWLARMALDEGDPDEGAAWMERVVGRCEAIESRWGGSPSTTLMRIEVAAELARLALARKDEDGAAAEVRKALAIARAAGVDAPDGDLDPMTDTLAGVLFGSGLGGAGTDLLISLAEHRAGEPRRAAGILDRLGRLQRNAGDEAAAYEAWRRALAGLGDADGRDDELFRAHLMTCAGVSADDLGEYALAGVMYQSALEIRKQHLPDGHPDLLLSVYNVAELTRATGDPAAAEPRLAEVADALRGLDAEAAARTVRLAQVLKNLALARSVLRRYDEAEAAAQEALGLAPPPDMRAQLLATLGEVREAQGRDPGVSDELGSVAAELGELYGKQSVARLFALFAQARALPPARAEAAERHCLDILGQWEGVDDPQTRGVLSQLRLTLGSLRWARGDHDGAFDQFAAAVPAVQEQRAELWRVRSAFEPGAAEPWPVTVPLVRLVASELAGRDDARRLAFRSAVSAKRLQAEALVGQRELVLQGRAELVDFVQLAAAIRRSVAWGRGAEPDVAALAQLESALAREVPREALLQIAERSSAAAVASALPRGSVLVEYVALPPQTARRLPTLTTDEASFVAFVLPAGEPEGLALVELGPAPPIADAVARLRDAIALGVPARSDWQTPARALAKLVWDPIAASAPAGADVFVAPDGVLCAVPFDALLDGDGETLLLSRTLTLLATGRDLHRIAARSNWGTSEPVVIAAPEFGEPWEPFGPLPGTVTEGAAVADLLEVDPLYGEAATRQEVLAVEDPEILHLATHGYFHDSPETGGLTERLAAAAARDPLLRSGLALACANRDVEEEEPGVVSALDVLGLQLAGTDLVVLSACESGLGTLSDEEGLLGLARSFLLAGARSVVWSLWRVDDGLSAALVEDVYRRLLGEVPRAVALRDAKRAVHAEQPQRVDVWAGFALQGDPGALMRFRFEMAPGEQIYTETAEVVDGVHMLYTAGKPVSVFSLDVGAEEPIRVASISLKNLQLGEGDEAAEHVRQTIEKGTAGDHPAAIKHARKAVALLEGQEGRERELAQALDNLAISTFCTGGDDEAVLPLLERALELKRAAFPREHEQVRFTLDRIAEVREALQG